MGKSRLSLSLIAAWILRETNPVVAGTSPLYDLGGLGPAKKRPWVCRNADILASSFSFLDVLRDTIVVVSVANPSFRTLKESESASSGDGAK